MAEASVMGKIAENVEAMLANQGDFDERLSKLEEDNKKQEKWLSKVDRKASSTRYASPEASTGEENASVRKRAAEALGFIFKGILLQHQDAEQARRWREQGYGALGVTQRAALQEDTNAEGGFLVPTQMFGTVMGLPLRMKGIARALCLHAMMTSKSMTIPTVANEPTVAITSEEGTFSDAWGSTPFGQGTMTAKKIGSLVTISEELIADSTPDVVGEVCVRRIASALIKKEDQQLLEGDGTGANFTGLFAAAGVNSVAGGGAQINLDKFLDALTVLPQDALEDESITIVMHHKLWFSLLKLKVAQYSTDTNGDYRLAGPGTEPTNMSIGGFPVRWCDQILTNRGAGTNETTAYAGSFKSAVYGDRQLMTLSVDPYTKLDTGQLRLRVMERIGLLIAVPADFVKITAIIP